MNRINVMMFAVVLVAVVGGDARAEGEPAGETVASAMAAARPLMEKGQWREVRAVMARVPEAERTVDVLYVEGMACLREAAGMRDPSRERTGLRRSGLALMREALEKDPLRRDVAVELARGGVWNVSLACASAAVAAYPDDPEIRLLAGQTGIAVWASKPDEVVNVLKVFLNEKHVQEARAIQRRGQRAARENFEAAVALGDAGAESRRWLGRLALERGEYEEAVGYLEAAHEIEPQPWYVRVELAEAYIGSDDLESAREHIGYALGVLTTGGKRASLYERIGDALVDAEYFDEAMTAYRQSYASDFNGRMIRQKLGRAALLAGQYRLALWGYGEAYRVDGATSGRLFGIAAAMYHLERFEASQKYLDAAVSQRAKEQKQPIDKVKLPAGWRHYRGRLAWERGDLASAKKDLWAALEMASKNRTYAQWAVQAALAADERSVAVLIAEKYGLSGAAGAEREAIATIEAILEKWPEKNDGDVLRGRIPHTVLAHRSLGRLYYKLGQWTTASVYFEKSGYDRAGFARLDAGYAHLRAGRVARAIMTLSDYQSNAEKATYRDLARVVLAAAHVANGDGRAALKFLKQIEEREFVKAYNVNVAAYGAARELMPTPPPAGNRLNGLGVIVWPQSRLGGAQVLAILPHSPLSKLAYPVRGGDVIVSVDGFDFSKSDQIEAFAGSKATGASVPIVVKVGDGETTMSFAAGGDGR